MLQNQVEPFLHDGRRRVPVKRMLKNNDVVRLAEGLFSSDVDHEVGVMCVKVVQRDTIEMFNGRAERSVNL